MVMSPCGLSSVRSQCWTSLGHFWNHTMGGRFLVPLNHTPPTPHLDASTNPWYVGNVGTNSLQKVGRSPISLMMYLQSKRVNRTSLDRMMCGNLQRLATFSALSNVPIKGLLTASDTVANCNFPCSFSKSFMGMYCLGFLQLC